MIAEIVKINKESIERAAFVIILVQRLGPSTGTATCGAQGDLLLLNDLISGGYPIPTFCISKINDCWEIPAATLSVAVKLRTPVILLTSKEKVMTLRSKELSKWKEGNYLLMKVLKYRKPGQK
ncbi:MAG: hypothetical protein COX49_03480 [bacterium (Candidatus Stahlbacteria) CG23_combo_of_CG06-09_8_20_14_all_40_9]|nr:MAG: hypothetical protein COX49_03480 [bacterium (Candidatus Stahlbacteria) CG23_combo_of_CG06-09_8_20_14_all_40_9]